MSKRARLFHCSLTIFNNCKGSRGSCQTSFVISS